MGTLITSFRQIGATADYGTYPDITLQLVVPAMTWTTGGYIATSSRDGASIILGGGSISISGGLITTASGGSQPPIIVAGPGTVTEVTLPVVVPAAIAIDGTVQEGQTLTATAGGIEVASYQWQELIGGAWINLEGATASTCALQQADVGRQVRVQVTGTDNVVVASAATNAVLDLAGNQHVYESADRAAIENGLFQYVYGIATHTTINGGGEQNIYAGGFASDTMLNVHGLQIDWGTAIKTTIEGGEQYVWGSATDTTINSGVQYVGGTADRTTVSAGGEQIIYGGGTASGTTIAGGNQSIYGIADQTTIENGGFQFVHGIATGTTVNDSQQNVYADGYTSGTTLNAGGVQVDWGVASDTSINRGGRQFVWGSATGTIIYNGAEQDVGSGASVSGTTLWGGVFFFDGALQHVWGSASDTVLVAGAQYIEAGGSANGTTIGTNTQVPPPLYPIIVIAKQFVYGSATGNVINNSGAQEVETSGTATDTTINPGGAQDVYGSAFQTTINGGTQIVRGYAGDTTIVSGSQLVLAGGYADKTTIGAGASQYVDGGTTHDVIFTAPSATLSLHESSELTGSISGWQAGDTIALNDIAFIEGTTTLAYAANSGNTGGTLTVSDGTHTAALSLLGQYTAGDFALSYDGHYGTRVIDGAILSQEGTLPTQIGITITQPLAA